MGRIWGKGGVVAELGELGAKRNVEAGVVIAAFAADGDHGDLARAVGTEDDLSGVTLKVGDEAAGEAAVRRDEEHGRFTDLALLEEGMRSAAIFRVLAAVGRGEVAQHGAHVFGVRPGGEGSLLRAAHLGGGDELERIGDLGRVFDRANAAADLAEGCHAVVSAPLCHGAAPRKAPWL